ncbi:MAG TPA: Uma2 family endonuclease [Bryobacteraceae bacterium]|jgi:Uma2 family endonuclease|nr:Uma2 family endonuclease [Bryobacteraceae bacterium]
MPSPDVFIVQQKLWRQAREGEYYPRRAPLLAAEVLSPANRLKNVKVKTELYLESGSLAVWNVRLRQREVTVHVQDRQVFTRQTGQTIQLPAEFGSVEIAIDDFFRLS